MSSIDMLVELQNHVGRSLPVAVTPTLITFTLIMVPVAYRVISNGIHFVEIRQCSKDLHSRSVLSKCSVPFLEIGHGPLKIVHAKCHC